MNNKDNDLFTKRVLKILEDNLFYKNESFSKCFVNLSNIFNFTKDDQIKILKELASMGYQEPKKILLLM